MHFVIWTSGLRKFPLATIRNQARFVSVTFWMPFVNISFPGSAWERTPLPALPAGSVAEPCVQSVARQELRNQVFLAFFPTSRCSQQ